MYFPIIWAYGQHFRIKKNDERRRIFDCGVMVEFDQESHVSTKYVYWIEEKL